MEANENKPKLGADRLPNGGNGRPKGATNKVTRELKEMILTALEGAGGEQYLIEQAEKSPAAFMTLIGKVLPMQVTGSDGGAIEITWRK
jgi:hypothetical protein